MFSVARTQRMGGRKYSATTAAEISTRYNSLRLIRHCPAFAAVYDRRVNFTRKASKAILQGVDRINASRLHAARVNCPELAWITK